MVDSRNQPLQLRSGIQTLDTNLSTKPESILSQARQTQVELEPFPHIIIRNALREDVYEALSNNFPNIEHFKNYSLFDGTSWGDPELEKKFPGLNNIRLDLVGHDCLVNQQIHPIWREFVGYHMQQEFFEEVTKLFAPQINRYYPKLARKLESIESLKFGHTVTDSLDDHDILLGASCGMNTPVSTPSRVRGPHIDIAKELYAGLLYMREPQDDSTGGELGLYKFKDRPHFQENHDVNDSSVELVNLVPYEPNTLVLFLNTLTSLHGVTPRSVTPFTRRFFIFGSVVADDLFDTSPYKITPPQLFEALNNVISLIKDSKIPEALNYYDTYCRSYVEHSAELNHIHQRLENIRAPSKSSPMNRATDSPLDRSTT